MYRHLDEDNFGDVGRFHAKFGLPSVTQNGPGPQEMDPELLKFRIKFLLEELLEFTKAAGVVLVPQPNGEVHIEDMGQPFSHPEMFDALLDLVYVAMGTAHMLGYPWADGWDRVQQANMAKVRAQADGSDSKRGSSFDVVKPPGWTPPDIERLLQAYGWDINQ